MLAELLRQRADAARARLGAGPLGLPGEQVWPLGPLALPPAGTRDRWPRRSGHPASALFLARWRQVRGGRRPTWRSTRWSRWYAGSAGCRWRSSWPRRGAGCSTRPEMLARYGNRLLELGSADVAASPPLVTLRDVVTASYRLLEPAQREALRRLAAFGYRWSVELAEDLLGPQVDVVPVLERLVELGLVQVRGSGAFRFVLLDVVKEYATEQAEVGR